MSDLIKRLRTKCKTLHLCVDMRREAADEIERLQARVEALESKYNDLIYQVAQEYSSGLEERLLRLEGAVDSAIDAFRNHGLTCTAQFKELLAATEQENKK